MQKKRLECSKMTRKFKTKWILPVTSDCETWRVLVTFKELGFRHLTERNKAKTFLTEVLTNTSLLGWRRRRTKLKSTQGLIIMATLRNSRPGKKDGNVKSCFLWASQLELKESISFSKIHRLSRILHCSQDAGSWWGNEQENAASRRLTGTSWFRYKKRVLVAVWARP
jgi:hypothetical protein